MPLSRYRYPSDTSDLEWALLERLLPTPACRTPKGGAPEKWPRRRVIDAIRYITDNGTKWRALPADFGIPWRTVFGYFARWAKAGVLRHILDQLRRRLRLHRGRCPWPVRVIVDSQSVKGAETVSKATRGYDANKHINGRKRHLLVDQDGLLVDLLVTPADVQDRDAARVLLTRLHAEHPEIVLVWADNGYGGDEFSTWAQTALGITVKVVSRPKDAKGFVLLPKRWVVERSNSWTLRARRNARDYERLMSHAEAHVQWAFITLMTRRLTRKNRRTDAVPTPLTAAA
ncbi:IS5 family transposase [Streptomyces sp. NBC_01450]|uniref:IS5 family transposase n=1 Tax=Streptomyces sp. NBC_01450 TaxID=2903871 RepID=UPI003FCCA037